MQLQDEQLPFERTEFSVALKKSLEYALNWYLLTWNYQKIILQK
jgi:hypothetical protein